MPIIRKIIKLGRSRVITIPADWLEYYRRKFGCDVIEVEMETNGKLKISARNPGKLDGGKNGQAH
jgi:hypothetical protein